MSSSRTGTVVDFRSAASRNGGQRVRRILEASAWRSQPPSDGEIQGIVDAVYGVARNPTPKVVTAKGPKEFETIVAAFSEGQAGRNQMSGFFALAASGPAAAALAMAPGNHDGAFASFLIGVGVYLLRRDEGRGGDFIHDVFGLLMSSVVAALAVLAASSLLQSYAGLSREGWAEYGLATWAVAAAFGLRWGYPAIRRLLLASKARRIAGMDCGGAKPLAGLLKLARREAFNDLPGANVKGSPTIPEWAARNAETASSVIASALGTYGKSETLVIPRGTIKDATLRAHQVEAGGIDVTKAHLAFLEADAAFEALAPFDRVAVVLPRPVTRCNEAGFLHSAEGAAIEWADGTRHNCDEGRLSVSPARPLPPADPHESEAAKAMKRALGAVGVLKEASAFISEEAGLSQALRDGVLRMLALPEPNRNAAMLMMGLDLVIEYGPAQVVSTTGSGSMHCLDAGDGRPVMVFRKEQDGQARWYRVPFYMTDAAEAEGWLSSRAWRGYDPPSRRP
jgi:hypothetical protein